MRKLKTASIGGFGHSVIVFDEMIGLEDVSLASYAPAYENEPLDIVTSHKIYNDQVKRFDDWRKMLEEVKPDVAIISTRLDKLTEISIAAADAGCNIICEKPLALTHSSLAELYEAVKKNNVELFAMHTMRSEGAFIAAREIYRKGLIGEVVLANGRKSYKWGTRPDWFAKRESYGGTIGWVGIHALDCIHYITGARASQSSIGFDTVMAMQGNFMHPDFPGCEDNCVLILQLNNGGHATVSVDFCRPSSAPTHGDDWVRIVGTKGVIEANASRGTCNLIRDSGLVSRRSTMRLSTGVSGLAARETENVPVAQNSKMFRNFLLSLLGKNEYEPELSTKDGFMLTHVCLCARDAADTGKMIKIEKGPSD